MASKRNPLLLRAVDHEALYLLLLRIKGTRRSLGNEGEIYLVWWRVIGLHRAFSGEDQEYDTYASQKRPQ
jgi:hypothetical protein